jgi:hypothetical protein
MPRGLYTAHSAPLTVLHSDLERYALGQGEVFVGTAGTVMERANASDFRFYVHQFYDAEGAKRERYLAGPVGSGAADGAAERLRARIRELKDAVPSLRLLGREGYSVVDRRTYATVASLHNHGVFAAGGMLIGSHAYGVLLNRLGARAAPYSTEDIDIARAGALAFEHPPAAGFLEMLRGSGIEFVEVPQLDPRQPPSSFKQRGKALFQVDLLVPSRDETFPILAVPELRAHATGLPYLGYLLAESQMGMLMSREGCCSVRVPLPERFAIHKLVVSRLRAGRVTKSTADLRQACVLSAVLAETHSGALETAIAQVPRRAVRHLRNALAAAQPVLKQDHPRAWAELSSGGTGRATRR